MRRTILVILLGLMWVWPLQAEWMMVDVERVPVERLVANLEAMAKEQPSRAEIQINLARAHGMAYAEKTETLPVSKQRPQDGIYLSYLSNVPPSIPYRAKPTEDPVKRAAANLHLKKSIEHFKAALAIASDNLVARLGLAWSIDQLGDKFGAIAAYREVIERAWLIEGKMTRAGLDFVPVTAEAAGYLIPLLDKNKDAAEIATLHQRSEKLLSLPRPITPVAVPLRDDLKLGDILDDEAAVRFDADGLGVKSWTWITPDAGWLVYDQIGRGEINSALQLFGNVSFWMFWDTGYDAMRVLDDNRDGRLAGAELRNLALWRDANSNGISDRGEVRSLSAYDIVSLSFDFARTHDADRMPFVAHGVTFRDGRTRPTWDVVLQPAR